jgi:Sulfatase-modifying factor enzyme 1
LGQSQAICRLDRQADGQALSAIDRDGMGVRRPRGNANAVFVGRRDRYGNASCNGCGQDRPDTNLVGRIRPLWALVRARVNAFGLYDMHGSVLEWVEDCYHDRRLASRRGRFICRASPGASSGANVKLGAFGERHQPDALVVRVTNRHCFVSANQLIAVSECHRQTLSLSQSNAGLA